MFAFSLAIGKSTEASALLLYKIVSCQFEEIYEMLVRFLFTSILYHFIISVIADENTGYLHEDDKQEDFRQTEGT